MGIRSLFKKKETEPHCAAVIVAAGSSTRMGSDKMMLKLGEVPVLVRTVRAFEKSPLVDEIIIVTKQEKILEIADMCKQYGLNKVSRVILGGATRAESCLAGVSEVKKGTKLIAIHDGARPLVTEEVILRTVYAARDFVSAVPVVPSVDTLKLIDEDGGVVGSLDRGRVVRVQTPQVFHADVIKGALTKVVTDSIPVTDDSSAVEIMGFKTKTVMGDEDNIKITTPEDMTHAATILKQRGEYI